MSVASVFWLHFDLCEPQSLLSTVITVTDVALVCCKVQVIFYMISIWEKVNELCWTRKLRRCDLQRNWLALL